MADRYGADLGQRQATKVSDPFSRLSPNGPNLHIGHASRICPLNSAWPQEFGWRLSLRFD